MKTARDALLRTKLPKSVARLYRGNESYSQLEDENVDFILAALDAAGYAVVPKEPTEEMLSQANGLTDFILPEAIGCTKEAYNDEMRDAYKLMLAAAGAGAARG